MPADIQNPRRILAVALTDSQDHFASFIGKLTGSFPSGSFAGSTHDLTLDTPYYRAQVPVWLDLVGGAEEVDTAGEETATRETDTKEEKSPDDAQAATKEEKSPYDDSDDDDDDDPVRTWADAFLADEASEVREALGGIVAVVDAGSYRRQKSLVSHVGRLARGCAPAEDGGGDEDGEGFSSWDGVGLVVGVSAAPLDDDVMLEWDDLCVAAGLEFVLVAPGQADANEWGEKTGVARVLEALKANDWQGAGGDAGDPFGFGDFQDGDGFVDLGAADDDDNSSLASLDFGYDKSDFEGLRQATWQQQTREVEDESKDGEKDNDGEKDVKDKKDKVVKDGDGKDGQDDTDDDKDITKLIKKLQAARMQGELLSPAQRRAMAARVVGEVMKDI